MYPKSIFQIKEMYQNLIKILTLTYSKYEVKTPC